MNEHAKKLSAFRLALLGVHKALLEAERITYEKKYGRVRSNTEFFRLVTQHEDFNWLRPLSALIVEFDQRLDEPELIVKLDVRYLSDQARILFRRTKSENNFSARFFAIIENFPHVILAYGEVSQFIKREPHVA